MKDGRNKGRKEGRNERRKAGRKGRKKENKTRRKEGRKEGRNKESGPDWTPRRAGSGPDVKESCISELCSFGTLYLHSSNSGRSVTFIF